MTLPFDVIVPVRNEAYNLARSAPALKTALDGLTATVIFVLNATTDRSEAVIRQTFGNQARIVQLSAAGKTAALRAGDQAATRSIRVYLDADVFVAPDIFAPLLGPLADGTADLVAPRFLADPGPGGGLAGRVGRVWADQLSRRPDAFISCTAFGPSGLRLRGPWPDVISDDDWARNRIEPARRKIVQAARARITPPRDMAGWLAVRARWIRGRRELKRLGTADPHPIRMLPRGSLPDLAVYYAVRLAAEPIALVQHWAGAGWGRDDSTRKRRDA